MTFDLRQVSVAEVTPLFHAHHGYGSVTKVATMTFAVFEDGVAVAAYVWNPPPFGAAKALSPDAPWGVLALSRMVAVPRENRRLKHVSKPLQAQMKRLIDRTRWPVLVSYSDASQGHTGYVYQCSGWTKGPVSTQRVYHDPEGRKVSCYVAGRKATEGRELVGVAELTRWTHYAVPVEQVATSLASAGWVREAIPGKVWASGNPSYRVVRRPTVA